jgi:hypothetical protein
MSLHLVLKSETDLNTYFLRVRGIFSRERNFTGVGSLLCMG